MAASVQVIQTPTAAAAVFKPDRLRLLEMLGEPDSAAGLARRLQLPRQTVNYHLRELEREGLVEFVEHRKKGNCTERVLRAAARAFVISPEALGALGLPAAEAQDRFSSAYLISAAARAIRDTTCLRQRASKANKKLATLTLETEIRFATPAARQAFTDEVVNLMASLAAKYHDDGAKSGRSFRFLFAGFPAITKDKPVDKTSIRLE